MPGVKIDSLLLRPFTSSFAGLGGGRAGAAPPLGPKKLLISGIVAHAMNGGSKERKRWAVEQLNS